MKANKLVFKILMLIVLTAFFSCGVKAQQVTSDSTQEQELKLVFLNYTISKDLKGTQEVQFVNRTITKGRLKDTSNKQVLSGAGDIECVQLDKKNGVLERTYIKNPLKPIVEYVNDDGNLEKRQLNLETAQFSIKLQLQERTQSVKLLLIDASGNATTELITTSISK